jgi:hypothetical protein
MVQITSRKELIEWLKSKPADFAKVIAARSALRVLPYAFAIRVPKMWVASYSLLHFRIMFVSWSVCNFPMQDMRQASADSADAAVDASINADYAAARSSVDAAYASVRASGGVDDALYASADAVDAAADAAYGAASVAYSLARGAIWLNTDNDCKWIDSVSNSVTTARLLTREGLWSQDSPRSWADAWRFACRRLLTLDPTYQVWIDWYNRRIEGHDAAFDIPGDSDRTEDKKILARLADATNEDFWDKGATYVNTTLQNWIDEARERVALPPKPTTAEVQAAVVKYASPDARIVDDRLDAGPNAIFDKPRYDGDLATLPSQLRAFIGALSVSLPRNAPDVIRHCLSAYSDELLVRGTQPIVSIVKGMASAIAAQVWIAPNEADKDDPDAWILKDRREWEPGTADLFRTFFKAHLDLITHFPLDPEREAMLAATPIDEMAASDKALTDPIDKVTDLIITLATDGHATDNIVRIVKALADYTRDIAGMPKPDEAGLPSTTITPKRRHVLQTAGFYLHAYSILGTTATLSTLPQVQALMVALADAAQRLMGFIL